MRRCQCVIVLALLGWLLSCSSKPTGSAELDASAQDGVLEPGDIESVVSDSVDETLLPDSVAQLPAGKIYYVRPKGGTPQECTGLVNADYPGSGTAQSCALKHLFYLLPPGGKPVLKGGEAVVIAAGSYRMGHGAPGADNCSSDYPWDCHMLPIPSGPSSQQPTRILGEGWNTDCKQPPQLFGVERTDVIVDLRASNNVEISCLEITDHSPCVESHAKSELACNRTTFPYGDWAANGILAADSSNVILKQLNIHGLASVGIRAGRLKDWLLEDVRIAINGWAGWDGDLVEPKGSSNSGTLTFRRVTIEWNGCGETVPGGKPIGCWAQTAGGYGDGLGTADTGGNWIFEDCRVLHNTSDGIDLLYHVNGGNITISGLRSEGNAGNQLKLTGNASVTNSVLVGNCGWFDGKSFTYNVDNCRALGNTLELAMIPGTQITLVNNTLFGQGDVLVDANPREGFSCNGSEMITALNNIFVGGGEFLGGDTVALFYQEGCPGLTLSGDYNVIHQLKLSLYPLGPHDLQQDPLLGTLSGEIYDMIPKSNSPAVDSGKPVGGLVPAVDFRGFLRPFGKGVDRGAYEVGSHNP